uniref:Uncharacterized protein n=1 Tax=Anguilla anguilla TaxID=7936 RepID=A0A0E9VUZ9_ANGAN
MSTQPLKEELPCVWLMLANDWVPMHNGWENGSCPWTCRGKTAVL